MGQFSWLVRFSCDQGSTGNEIFSTSAYFETDIRVGRGVIILGGRLFHFLRHKPVSFVLILSIFVRDGYKMARMAPLVVIYDQKSQNANQI